LCLLLGTNWIYICYIEESRPPLWSSGQSSWLHNRDVLCLLLGTNWIYICYIEESRPPLWSSGQSSWLHNAYVLCLLWGTNWIYICYVEESRPPLWSSGESSWLQKGLISVRFRVNSKTQCGRKDYVLSTFFVLLIFFFVTLRCMTAVFIVDYVWCVMLY
jgi:hypothetical protein